MESAGTIAFIVGCLRLRLKSVFSAPACSTEMPTGLTLATGWTRLRRRRGGAGWRRRRGPSSGPATGSTLTSAGVSKNSTLTASRPLRLGIGPHFEGARRARHHADAQAARQHAIAARGVDLIAGIERRAVGKELQSEARRCCRQRPARATPAGPTRTGMRLLRSLSRSTRATEVAGIDDAPDQALAVMHGVADAHAVVATEIDQHASEKGPARIGDDVAVTKLSAGLSTA